ncbi:uracil-DNA glycosylase [Streptomyces pacificus]|uniref:Type-5 uracil-DNA glycosylase n=1 Tax=Streptomyces pacificus TaxID=2705029 RepID=A0A6A0B0U5_9ACTN|nr:uracil-DNA glycosylase [Streptomyces pacificus]GFH38333.1 uracil-DNA glycosylase [Streptomyces pacificus]
MERPRGRGAGASADDPLFPVGQAPRCAGLDELDGHIARCRACPRLVAWREEVAGVKRAAFQDQEYWGRPVPGFGPADAPLAVIGLAPAAHGANRTGRMFTGDTAGDFLFAALYEAGLASQPSSRHTGDGLTLRGVRLTSPVHCAPPANLPTADERDTCRHWLSAELRLLAPGLRAVVALGGFGWRAVLPAIRGSGRALPRPRPAFGHGAHALLPPGEGLAHPLHLLGSYHPSRRNTFTGRLTLPMLVDVLRRAAELAGLPAGR